MNERRTVGVGATLAAGSQITTAVLGGALGIIVARLLGPTEAGLFSVALSALLVLGLLSTLGIHLGATYHVSGGRWDPGDAFRQSQLGAFVFGAVGGLAGLGLALTVGTEVVEGIPDVALGALAAAVPFAVSWSCSSFLALGLDRYETYASASVIANLAALVLVAALTPELGLGGAVAGLAAAQALTAVSLVYWGRTQLPRAKPGWLRRAPAELRRAASFGLRGYAANLLVIVSQRADLFILSAVAAGAQVGQYAVALSVTELGLMLPRAMNAVVLPRVAALDSSAGEAEQRMVIVKSVRHAVLQAPLTAGVLVIGLLAVPLVYGSDFGPAIEPGLILIPGTLALGAANVTSAIVTGKGFPQYTLYAWLVLTPLAVLLYALLIPALEMWGAALASTFIYVANALVTAWFFVRVTNVRSLREIVPRREDVDDYVALLKRFRARRDRPAD